MASSPKSIVIFTPWFGRWPDWMKFYLQSCRYNPDVSWVLISDCPPLADLPANVRLLSYSFADYRKLCGERLGLACRWDNAYKICDLRPAYAEIHRELIEGYDYWGYGDLDVVYGRIRDVYTDEVLSNDIVSTHPEIVCGHFALMRNSPEMNGAFRRVRGWRHLLSQAEHRSFDERAFSNLFVPVRGTFASRVKQRLRSPHLDVRGRFVERFSTNLRPRPWIDGSQNYPKMWTWDRGRLTADVSGERAFLYLHFSNWQSARWTDDAVAPWSRLDRLDNVPEDRPERFTISAAGFNPG